MNLIKVLHETAMEFVDFADRAKNKGDMSTYTDLINKAYLLEKEAALKMFYSGNEKNRFWKFILLRSAGWLALQAGNQEQAAYFAKLGLNNQPPEDLKLQFENLLTQLKATTIDNKISNTEIPIQLKGILTQANAQQKEIYLQDPESEAVYFIYVPEHLIDEIVKSYWSALVTIEGTANPLGVITLEKIQLAA